MMYDGSLIRSSDLKIASQQKGIVEFWESVSETDSVR